MRASCHRYDMYPGTRAMKNGVPAIAPSRRASFTDLSRSSSARSAAVASGLSRSFASAHPAGGPARFLGARVLAREAALEHVHAVLAAGLAVRPPREALAPKPAARRVLPLGLGGEPGAAPGAERARVVPGDVDDGMVAAPVDARLRPLGMAPVRTLDLPPPRRARDRSSGGEVLRQEAAEHERRSGLLRVGDVPGRLRELGVALVR